MTSMAHGERAEQVGPRARMSPTQFWLLLLVVAAVAVGIRVTAVRSVPHTPANVYALPAGEGFYYLQASRLLAETGEYGYRDPAGEVQPDALHPPLFTTVLAIGNLLGVEQVDDVRLLSCALGVATTVLVGLAGRRMLTPATGIVAAGIVALSPAFWLYERNVNAEAVTFTLIAATILLAYRYWHRPGLWRCVALGGVGGLLALARAEQAVCVAIIVLVLVVATPDLDLRGRLARVGAAAAAGLVVIAPWTVYNLGRFEQPVLLSAGSGNAMSAGACDTTFDGDLLGSFDNSCIIVRASLDQRADRTVQDAAQRAEAIDFTRARAGRLPIVVAAREGRTWGLYRVADQIELHAAALDAPASLVWVQTVAFWASVPLAVCGAVLLRRRRIPLTPLLAFPAVAALTVAVTFGDIRYRAPADVPLVLLVAAAVVLLATRLGETRGQRRSDQVPAERLDDARGPVLALDLDGDDHGRLDPALDVLDLRELGATPDAGPDRHR